MRQKIPHRFNEELQREEKFCPKCNEGEGAWHPIENFNKKRASYDGLETKCKDCTVKKSKSYRDSNPEYDKKYQEKNKDYLKAYKKEYYMRKKNRKKLESSLEKDGSQ
jgi:hypothetical protein